MQELDKYSTSIRVLHWLMLALIAVTFVLGVVMVAFKETQPWSLYNLHKSLGVTVFLLVWLRLLLRWQQPTPAHPDFLIPLQQYVAKGLVVLLYMSMIIVPMSGYAMSNLNGHAVKWFGISLPNVLPEISSLGHSSSELHESLAYIFLGIVAVHVAAVILHHIRGEDVLKRIT
jgi:cytochrome b561